MELFQIKELAIKNMICSRCLKVLLLSLEPLGVEVLELKLGRLKIKYPKKDLSLNQIEQILLQDEFEIIKDKDGLVSEQIKLLLIERINDLPFTQLKKLSVYLAKELKKDYWTLSKIFSKTEGITLEKYFILLRIEKAKELIAYGELNFSQIAFELGYNSVYHLSGQFKQVTGMSMSEYKKLPEKPRKPLDKII